MAQQPAEDLCMKNKRIIFLLLLISHFSFLIPYSLSALGKQDADEIYLNETWTLCITEFDYSRLPPSRHLAGSAITRNLLNKLNSVSYRLRISPEYAYYESYAWQQEVSVAAKAVSNKQNERSQLLFRGDADWKYRSDIKRIDADLVKLQEALAQVEAEKPLIEKEPVFDVTEGNKSGAFPLPPKRGTERRFCQSQRADAFLKGEIWEYHARYYIHIMLFALYTDSWIYEDDIIFSLEDSEGAVEEIAARLTAVLSGNRPAVMTINAEPGDSQILINQNYAGRGTVEEREHPPGKVVIAVAAEGYTSEMVETELIAGELTEFNITLSPLYFADVNIDAQGYAGARVYSGSLYVGQAPLTLRLPINQLEYISIEGRSEMANAVFSTPDLPTDVYNFSLKMKVPPAEGKRVNKARSWYYWAWGGAWVAGIAAWVINGIYNGQVIGWNVTGNPDLMTSLSRMNIVKVGAFITFGTIGVYSIIQLTRYLYTSTERMTPILKGRKSE
jgi:hypothetical protein